MKTVRPLPIARFVVLAALLASLCACSSMSRSQRHAGIGAAAGGALGYLLTGGPLGTVAGAAVGGIVGAGH